MQNDANQKLQNQTTEPDIVEIVRQRLADGRHVADHDVLRLVGTIDAYRVEIERLHSQLESALDRRDEYERE